jgi:parallel beta-helix repeat protein
MPPPPPPPAASRRGLVLALSGVGVAGGLGFLTYVRTTPVPFWVPSTPTPLPTATPIPPTPTPVPTATPVPPTPTPGPKRLVVDASGSGDYRTIASAILGARPQDTIVLRPGTYKESLTVRSDVRIVGEGGRSKVIVEGAPGANVFTFTAGIATLTGLTIRMVGTGPADTGSGAIAVLAGTPVIEDCDLTSSAGAAVYIYGAGANPVIRNCTMRNSSGSGVHVYDQGQGTIEKCVISGNALAGVAIKQGGNPVVRDCEIRDNKESGVLVSEQGRGTIERCVISGNALGMAIRTGGNPTVRDCEIRDNTLAGVVVISQGQGTFTGNTLTGNAGSVAWLIGADAGRVTRTGNRPNA